MTAIERDEITTTVRGVAPGVVTALQRAARVAADHGHNWIGWEELFAAMLTPDLTARLQVGWPDSGLEALTLQQLRDLAESIVPNVAGTGGPAEPATVTYEVSGPRAAEITTIITRTS